MNNSIIKARESDETRQGANLRGGAERPSYIARVFDLNERPIKENAVDGLRGLNTRETKRQVRGSGRKLQKERVMESFMDLSGRGA